MQKIFQSENKKLSFSCNQYTQAHSVQPAL